MTETSRAECIQFKLVMYKSVALELEEILRFRGGAVVVGIGIYQICGSKITSYLVVVGWLFVKLGLRGILIYPRSYYDTFNLNHRIVLLFRFILYLKNCKPSN